MFDDNTVDEDRIDDEYVNGGDKNDVDVDVVVVLFDNDDDDDDDDDDMFEIIFKIFDSNFSHKKKYLLLQSLFSINA